MADNNTSSGFVNASMVQNLLPKDLFEALAKGKLKLYKHYKKEVFEVAACNSAKGEKKFENQLYYYITSILPGKIACCGYVSQKSSRRELWQINGPM